MFSMMGTALFVSISVPSFAVSAESLALTSGVSSQQVKTAERQNHGRKRAEDDTNSDGTIGDVTLLSGVQNKVRGVVDADVMMDNVLRRKSQPTPKPTDPPMTEAQKDALYRKHHASRFQMTEVGNKVRGAVDGDVMMDNVLSRKSQATPKPTDPPMTEAQKDALYRKHHASRFQMTEVGSKVRGAVDADVMMDN